MGLFEVVGYMDGVYLGIHIREDLETGGRKKGIEALRRNIAMARADYVMEVGERRVDGRE